MSMEPFNRLVKLAARAFYDDVSIMGESQSKPGRIDNRGMAVIVLDALTRRQWVREEDLAKSLKLHSKQLRRTLRFFEEEKLITREHRKESAKGAKIFNAAIAATGDSQTTKEGEEKMKMHMHSYCCLDYAQIFDVVRYRMHRMKKKLKDELDSRNTIQEYICPNCGRRYSAFDALQLVSMEDEYFHCENCNGELVAESEKLASEQLGDGDDNARRRRREKLKDMFQKMEDQLKPLVVQLARVKDLPAPEFGTLQAWEARARAASQANSDSNASDFSKNIQGQGYSGTPMPFLGETSIEVALSGVEAKEETEPDIKPTAMKVLPPWMIKQGMNLTAEQRRGIKPEPNAEHNSDDKKSSVDDKKPSADRDNEKSLQDEYLKAYYAALVKRQEEEETSKRIQQQTELSTSAAEEPVHRRVGMKSKREDDEDIEWEDAAGTGNSSKSLKLADLNAEADASEDDDNGDEDDDDDIAWEEG